MAQFHTLIVTEIHKTIRDAVVLTLKPDTPDAFNFTQGQYLTFRRDFDGEELRRSYSICSGPSDGVLQVGIKRVDGGVFSSWANAELKVGETLEAMAPMGNFYAKPTGDDPHILAFAAGSGITPILSIIRSALSQQTSAICTLVYGNRNPNTIMFREELEDLKNEHLGRLNVIHVLSEESQDIDLFRGRIDASKCSALFSTWIDTSTVTKAYICGPEEMMETVSTCLKENGLSKEQIRFELFAASQPGRAKAPAKMLGIGAAGVTGRMRLGGETRSLQIAAGTSLLDAALENNLDPPYACKAGVCSTCKAKVTEGEVEMVTNHALEDYEVDAGYVLTCQCFPLSETVAWDYDQAGH